MSYNFASDIGDFLKREGGSLQIVQNHPCLPQHPFRMLVVGPSGTGKTNMLLNMLLDKGDYKVGYTYLHILTRMPDEPAYRYLEEELVKKEDIVNKKLNRKGIEPVELFNISSSLQDLPDLEDMDPERMNIVVFDDMCLEKDQHGVEEYFIMARKKNVSLIYLTQSYFQTSKTIRLQCQYYAIFTINSKIELSLLAKEHATDLTNKEFINILTLATRDHGFLVIDKTKEGNKSMKYRLNFYKKSKWEL